MLDCQINLVPLYYDKGRNHSIADGSVEGRQCADNRSYQQAVKRANSSFTLSVRAVIRALASFN